MITYTCDKCGKEYKQPLDRVTEVINGDKVTIDMCASCRKKLRDEVDTFRKEKVMAVVQKGGK